ncbi:MAG: hypothetical protein B7Z54_08835, partial [Sphingobacteriales bacterium 12-47-4]
MHSSWFRHLILLFTLSLLPGIGKTQYRAHVKNRSLSWFSIITQVKLNDKWILLTDFHHRRDEFMANPNFYFLRSGIGRSLPKNHVVSAGVAHMWLSASVQGEHFFTDENRLYEQWNHTSKWGK